MDKYYILRGFNRNVSFIISPVDAFLRRPVAGKNIEVILKDTVYKKPIVKKEGYYVFTDLPLGLYDVEIKSKEYFPVRLTTGLNAGETVFVEIIPNRNYKPPSGTTCISGYFKKDTRAYVIPSKVDSGIRLTAHDEESVTLYASYNIDLSNKRFAIRSGDNAEIFETSEKLEKNIFRLKTELKREYRRGESIHPVSLGQTDSSGYLFCPLTGITEMYTEIMIGFGNCDWFNKYEIEYGKVNYLREV